MEVLKEEIITNAEAKKIFSEIEKDKPEQKMCSEYLNKIPMISKSDAEKLEEELSKLNIFNKKQIITIINTLPEVEEEFLMLFSKEKYKKEEIKTTLEIVKKYIKS
ncbi:MAG: hypothetical protein QW758_00565 [Candidatus Aenigmatarchaeota archaeon]